LNTVISAATIPVVAALFGLGVSAYSRAALAPRKGAWSYLGLGADQLRVGLLALMVIALWMTFQFVAGVSTLIGIAHRPTTPSGAGGSVTLLQVLSYGVAFLLIVAVTFRLWLAPAHILSSGSFDLSGAWRLTGRGGWRLTVAFVVCVGGGYLIQGTASLVIASGVAGFSHVHTTELVRQIAAGGFTFTAKDWPMWAVIVLLSFVSAVAYPVMLCSAAYIYGRLNTPIDEVF
ncbi:MAG TPA: hypothetical protein VFN88_10880, partial [Caulobacteraceae bacterium]|nr:hypothetical protein [Caulobacteraceae bacterium]